MLKEATLKGTAKDAKAGAVIVVDDGRVVYLEGLDSWPNGSLNKRVEAKGVLVSKKFIPDPVNENGDICQGAEGDQLVIERPKWTIL